MSGNLSKKPDLLIVSDTPMWHIESRNLAFEPVIREIEVFYPLFNKITWIGFRHDNQKIQDSAVELKKAKVDYVMLDNIGGNSFSDRIKILFKLPGYCLTIWKYLKKSDVVHARGPSLPAYFALWASKWLKIPVFWYKYAGNWDLDDPPKSYRLQRGLLKRSKHVTGTINGHWANQQKHLLSFENPCFTLEELDEARKAASSKSFSGPLNLVFVGRIEERKGFDRLLEALAAFEPNNGIAKAYFVGGGPQKSYFEEKAKELLKINYEFTGPLKRDRLNEIYGAGHIFCLPSLSEGFPKVLAESAAFGCVPIVSDLSCIGQYIIHRKNGMLLEEISPSEIKEYLNELLFDRDKLSSMAEKVNGITDKFTYEYYTDRIKNDILRISS